MKTPQSLAVSIIIPVLNGAEVIAGCLEAVLAQDLPRTAYEVLVIDNGSTDATPAVVRRYPVRLLHESFRSPYAARNTGVRHARGTLLAFTDDDCRPAPTWLRAAVTARAAGAQVLAGQVVHTIENARNPWECHSALFFLRQADYVAQGWAATANLCIPRALFEQVGPFHLVRSGGDKEWGLRATAQGIRLTYHPEVTVTHLTRKSFKETAAKIYRDAWSDGYLEQPRSCTGLLPMHLLLKKRPWLSRALQMRCAFLDGRAPASSLWTILLAWPMLESVRIAAFCRGWYCARDHTQENHRDHAVFSAMEAWTTSP